MEGADIVRCRPDRRDERVLHFSIGPLKLLLRDPDIVLAKPDAVKFLRVPEQGGVALLFDGGHDLFHGLVLLRRSVVHFPLQLEIPAGLHLHCSSSFYNRRPGHNGRSHDLS
ncbi:hypothetical protein D3C71_1600330 [compost metagenome]